MPEHGWTSIGREPFVALTTFRRTGVGVTTPVWIAPDGDALVVTTEARVGKVKRLRNDARVTLQPCSRFGKVAPDAPLVHGTAEILGLDRLHPAATTALRRKYGRQYTVVLAVERVVRRLQREDPTRVIIRIEPA